jgi:hypothetical protein
MPSRAQDARSPFAWNVLFIAHSPFRPIADSPIPLDNHHFLAMFLGLVPVAP